MPTTISTMINNWQNSAEKSQAHNLKVVGSNPTSATNYINKIADLDVSSRTSVFEVFLCYKLDNGLVILTIVTTRRK